MRVIASQRFASTKYSPLLLAYFLENSRTGLDEITNNFLLSVSGYFLEIFSDLYEDGMFLRHVMSMVRSFETSGINDLATRCNKPQNLNPISYLVH